MRMCVSGAVGMSMNGAAGMSMNGVVSMRVSGAVGVCTMPKSLLAAFTVTEDDLDSISGFARSIEGVRIGIMIREVEDDAVYDRAVERQVEEVKAASKIRCVDDLLRSGATWEVE